MSTVTFLGELGGDGSTVTDDNNPTTGLDDGGHVYRFVPALAQTVEMARTAKNKAAEAKSSADAALASKVLAEAAQMGSIAMSLNVPTGMPTIKPSLLLDFANSERIDPRITFARATTAVTINQFGLFEAVAINIPRIAYDPLTLQCLGLLIEGANTNLALQSEAFSVSGTWTLSGTATVTAHNASSPWGTTVADTLNMPASGDRINQLITVLMATIYTFSLWASGSGTMYISLVNANGGSGTTTLLINLTNTRTRYEIAHTTSGSTTQLYCVVGRWNGANAGTATSAVIFGGQLEAGEFASSYILTTTAAVTRSADIAALTGAYFSSWYNQPGGTLFAECVVSNAARLNIIVQCDDTTANERILLMGNVSLSVFKVIDGGVEQVQIAGGTLVSHLAAKMAGCYQLNDGAVSQDGAAVTVDTAATLPSPNQARIGTDGTNYLYGTLSRIVYYPQRLSNTALQRLTS